MVYYKNILYNQFNSTLKGLGTLRPIPPSYLFTQHRTAHPKYLPEKSNNQYLIFDNLENWYCIRYA